MAAVAGPHLPPESVTKEEGGIDFRWDTSLFYHSPDRSLPKSADPMQVDGWTYPGAERGGTRRSRSFTMLVTCECVLVPHTGPSRDRSCQQLR